MAIYGYSAWSHHHIWVYNTGQIGPRSTKIILWRVIWPYMGIVYGHTTIYGYTIRDKHALDRPTYIIDGQVTLACRIGVPHWRAALASRIGGAHMWEQWVKVALRPAP